MPLIPLPYYRWLSLASYRYSCNFGRFVFRYYFYFEFSSFFLSSYRSAFCWRYLNRYLHKRSGKKKNRANTWNAMNENSTHTNKNEKRDLFQAFVNVRHSVRLHHRSFKHHYWWGEVTNKKRIYVVGKRARRKKRQEWKKKSKAKTNAPIQRNKQQTNASKFTKYADFLPFWICMCVFLFRVFASPFFASLLLFCFFVLLFKRKDIKLPGKSFVQMTTQTTTITTTAIESILPPMRKQKVHRHGELESKPCRIHGTSDVEVSWIFEQMRNTIWMMSNYLFNL